MTHNSSKFLFSLKYFISISVKKVMIMIRMKPFNQKTSIITMTISVTMMFQKDKIQHNTKLCKMHKLWIFRAGD